MMKKYSRSRSGLIETTPKFRMNRHNDHRKDLYKSPSKNWEMKLSSERQQIQQMKWMMAVQFAATFAVSMTVANKYNTYKGSGRSDVIKYIVDNAIVGTYPHFKIDYSQVVTSYGWLSSYWAFKACLSAAGQLNIITSNCLPAIVFALGLIPHH